MISKDEVRQSLELKRNKIKDAFDLIKFPMKTLIETENESGDKIVFKETAFVKSEFEYIINYSVFEKLMRKVSDKFTDKQVNILFELLDLDANRLLSKTHNKNIVKSQKLRNSNLNLFKKQHLKNSFIYQIY